MSSVRPAQVPRSDSATIAAMANAHGNAARFARQED